MIDYYEFLQISPHADAETIHRVYRFLASRFHPDNPQSGNADLFHLVKSAYDVLSDPVRRAEYDKLCTQGSADQEPLSASVDFMDNMEGELNRRLALLAVLYHQRRSRPELPQVSLFEIEERMGFPRDYLDFTIWYLVQKGYMTRADNAEFTLTAEGVDFVETHRGTSPVLNKLLTAGSVPSPEDLSEVVSPRGSHGAHINRLVSSRNGQAGLKPDPIILPSQIGADGAEWRKIAADRRVNKVDRRVNPRGRRATD